jgi:hypothetical protein
MNKANISSFKIKNESLDWQKKILNEATGMISGMQAELTNLRNNMKLLTKALFQPCEIMTLL